MERIELQERCRECVEMFEQFYEGKHNKYSAAYAMGTIKKLSKDIPALLDALDAETKRAEALERAIKRILIDGIEYHLCDFCVCPIDVCYDCDFGSLWQFDEAKFADRGEQIND